MDNLRTAVDRLTTGEWRRELPSRTTLLQSNPDPATIVAEFLWTFGRA